MFYARTELRKIKYFFSHSLFLPVCTHMKFSSTQIIIVCLTKCVNLNFNLQDHHDDIRQEQKWEMQALSTTTQTGSLSSASSSNSNSSTDDTHEHNNSIIMEQSSGASSTAVSETGMLTDQHCYSMDNCSSISAVSSITSNGCPQQHLQQQQQHNNNNTIAINNNNCDTIKNNNQPLTAAKATPLELANDVEAVPAAVALIDQQNALLRGVNIGNVLFLFT